MHSDRKYANEWAAPVPVLCAMLRGLFCNGPTVESRVVILVAREDLILISVGIMFTTEMLSVFKILRAGFAVTTVSTLLL